MYSLGPIIYPHLSCFLSLSPSAVTPLFDLCMKILVDNIDGKNYIFLHYFHHGVEGRVPIVKPTPAIRLLSHLYSYRWGWGSPLLCPGTGSFKVSYVVCVYVTCMSCAINNIVICISVIYHILAFLHKTRHVGGFVPQLYCYVLVCSSLCLLIWYTYILYP